MFTTSFIVPPFDLSTSTLGKFQEELVGRERELCELVRVLAERRLVRRIGVGGAGKTRLALEVVERLEREIGIANDLHKSESR